MECEWNLEKSIAAAASNYKHWSLHYLKADEHYEDSWRTVLKLSMEALAITILAGPDSAWLIQTCAKTLNGTDEGGWNVRRQLATREVTNFTQSSLKQICKFWLNPAHVKSYVNLNKLACEPSEMLAFPWHFINVKLKPETLSIPKASLKVEYLFK